MKEFFVNLFKNPNFPTYCGIAIAVLASLFIIIFVLGKRDKKKFDETQALKLDEINKKNEAILAEQAKAKEMEVQAETTQTVTDAPAVAPVPETPVAPAPLSAPVVSETNSVTEVVPEINPNEIPATPIEEMPVSVPKQDEEVYRVSDDPNEIVETNTSAPQAFTEYPEITPVMPEDTIEHLRSLNAELDKDITSLEKVTTPNVAPVEVIADTLDATPAPMPIPNTTVAPNPMPVPNTVPAPQAVPVQSTATVRPQVFSAVNAPTQVQNNIINDGIDSL